MTNRLLSIGQLALPNELNDTIKSFLYHDVTSMKYARHLASKREPILKLIKMADSRYNHRLFHIDEDPDTHEHWVFGFSENIEERLALQCNNCSKCGNYQIIGDVRLHCYCKTKKVPIMCLCSSNIYRNYVNYEEDDNDFDNDEEYVDFDMAADTDDYE